MPEPSDLIDLIYDECDGEAFEHLIARLWDELGWETQHVGGVGDKGQDIIATTTTPVPMRHVIQTKCQEKRIHREKVSQYASQNLRPNVDCTIIVTTSEFTRGAKEASEEYNVKLVDGTRLGQLLHESDHLKWLPEYFNQGIPLTPDPSDQPPIAIAELVDILNAVGLRDEYGFQPTVDDVVDEGTSRGYAKDRLYETLKYADEEGILESDESAGLSMPIYTIPEIILHLQNEDDETNAFIDDIIEFAKTRSHPPEETRYKLNKLKDWGIPYREEGVDGICVPEDVEDMDWEEHRHLNEGNFDVDMVEAGRSRDDINDPEQLIQAVDREHPHEIGAPYETVISRCIEELGYSKSKAEHDISSLKQKGTVYEPERNQLKTT